MDLDEKKYELFRLYPALLEMAGKMGVSVSMEMSDLDHATFIETKDYDFNATKFRVQRLKSGSWSVLEYRGRAGVVKHPVPADADIEPFFLGFMQRYFQKRYPAPTA